MSDPNTQPEIASPADPRLHRLRLLKRSTLVIGGAGLFIAFAILTTYLYLHFTVPKLSRLTDYHPSLVTEVYARDGRKFAEYSNERRFLIAYTEIPEPLVKAFVASEDANFFQHEGIDFRGILRAFFKNLIAGRVVQGGSTITQQVAKSLLLSSERSFQRKLKEVFLARRIEKNLSKEEILYLYLNQIYLGHGAYGIKAAAESYFQKNVQELRLAECALLAGLPQAPSRYSPFRSWRAAKERQMYVLQRMQEVGYITPEEMKSAAEEPITVYHREDIAFQLGAADFAEYVRRYVQDKYGSEALYRESLRIHTSLDIEKQHAATESVRQGLEELDRRQGYRGPVAKIDLKEQEAVDKFLQEVHEKACESDSMVIPGHGQPDPQLPEKTPLDAGKPIRALIIGFDAQGNNMTVRVGTEEGRMHLEDLKWARSPDPETAFDDEVYYVKDLRKKFKGGDVVWARVKNPTAEELKSKKFEKGTNYFTLYQEPVAQGALTSIDLATSEVLAMVGGYDFHSSEFNRAIQSIRQPGSAFKPIIYAAAMDKGYTASSIIVDSPIVYENVTVNENEDEKWRPKNYTGKFAGDTTFRSALVKSMNVITIKILSDIGIEYAAAYARKMGISSIMNRDLSLALGSSDVSLLELTNLYGIFGRDGRKTAPLLITKVIDRDGQVLEENKAKREDLSKEREALESAQEEEEAASPTPAGSPASAAAVEEKFRLSDEEREILYLKPPAGHILSPQTAYLMTSLLSDVISYGTGQRARAIGRPAAGKTGTTNDETDTWFVGYTPDIVTGVWVGYDLKKPLGRGENGGRTSAPIWLYYMREATKNQPVRNFHVPPGIVFATIDKESGYLARSSAPPDERVRAAFLEGTQPTTTEAPKDSVPEDQFDLIEGGTETPE